MYKELDPDKDLDKAMRLIGPTYTHKQGDPIDLGRRAMALLKVMEVGQSMIHPSRHQTYGVHALFYKLKPKKFVAKQTKDLELRIWRVE